MINQHSHTAKSTCHISKTQLKGLNISPNTVNGYLTDLDEDKSLSSRLLAYLANMEIIPKTGASVAQWSDRLNDLIDKYYQMKKHYINDASTEDIQKELDPIIPRDMKRSIGLYGEYRKELDFNNDFLDDPKHVFSVIYLILSKEMEGFSYLQGNDRFLYIASIIVEAFCEEIDLAAEKGEALIYYLFKGFMEKMFLKDIIHDQEKLNNFFLRISVLFVNKSPLICNKLASFGLKPEMFAMNYVILLFVEQHVLRQLLTIWDQIQLHIDQLESYVSALVVAHVNQIDLGRNAAEASKRILKENDFFLQRLIYEANELVGSAQNIKEGKSDNPLSIRPFLNILIPLFGIIVVVFFILK